MLNDNKITVIQKLEAASRRLAKTWGNSEMWEEIFSDMCCAFIAKDSIFADKPIAYIIKACKNAAINSYLGGRSICSKHRDGVKVISIEDISENVPTKDVFERKIHLKILVEDIFKLLTHREKQVAHLIMLGNKEKEIAEVLNVSQQRINRIKKNIRIKAGGLMKRRVVI